MCYMMSDNLLQLFTFFRPTPAGVPTQGVQVSCVDQLKAFPAPRYPAAPKPRKLGPLSNCMDPQYMAGENQPNTTKYGVINGSIDNQRELAANWGYAIFLGNVEQLAIVRNAPEYNLTMELANSMPTTPFEVSIIRDNVYNISSPRGSVWNVQRHTPVALFSCSASCTYMACLWVNGRGAL